MGSAPDPLFQLVVSLMLFSVTQDLVFIATKILGLCLNRIINQNMNFVNLLVL